MWALASDIGFEAATEIVLGATMAGPDSVPDAVRLSFVADDDDGLLGTRRPTSRHWKRPRTAGLSLVRRTAGPPATTSGPPHAMTPSRSSKTTAAATSISRATTPIRTSDQLVVSVVQPGQLGTLECSPMPCRYVPRPEANGTESLTYTVIDTFGGEATATVHIQIAPVEDPLSVSGHGDVEGFEDVPSWCSYRSPIRTARRSRCDGSSAPLDCLRPAPLRRP